MKIKKILSVLIILQLFIVFSTGNNSHATIVASKAISVHITADDTFDLYVNGTYIGSNTTNWRSAANFPNIKLLPGKNVIAIHCKNTILNYAGLNAYITTNYGNSVYSTNSSWKATRNPSSDWTSVNCNDSGWANASEYGAVGTYPWTDPISNYYGDSEKWIWMGGLGTSYEGDEVYFRYTIDSNNMGSTLYNDAEISTCYERNTLYTNEYLQSSNGMYKLILQSDGNLVLYNKAGRALWDTCTNGHTDINRAVLQWDENFVLYGTKARWDTCSNMNGSWCCWLVVQDDGNIVIYDNGNHGVVWSRW